jgi:hypothetical protein
VSNDDAVLWLRSLIWPEHEERAARLGQAITVLRAHPPQLVAGDALQALPEALARVPQHMVVCVYHSFVVNQFTQAERDRLTALLAELSHSRPINRVSLEWLRTQHPQLELSIFRNGAEAHSMRLARCDGHARWLEWLDN